MILKMKVISNVTKICCEINEKKNLNNSLKKIGVLNMTPVIRSSITCNS